MNMQSQVRVDSTGPYEARPFFFLFFLDVPPFHPQLIQQSTAVPNFPSSGNAIIDNSIVSLYNVPGDGSCFFSCIKLRPCWQLLKNHTIQRTDLQNHCF